MKILTLFLLTQLTIASDQSPMSQRFLPWLKTVEKALDKSSNPKKAADHTIKGLTRIASFNLQALGKIYRPVDEEFKKLGKDFKKLEDAIGDYTKWRNILTAGQSRNLNKNKLSKIKEKTKTAKKELSELLEDKWLETNRLVDYEKFIREYDFGSYDEDKSFVAKQLRASLEKLQKTRFNMEVLEEGNGVHELRRELRWFAIKARVLGGLFQFKKPSTCPVVEFKNLSSRPVASSKYGKLPYSAKEVNPCYIDQCLFLGLVQKVNQIGDLKDAIEEDLNLRSELSDETPEKYLPTLNKHYKQIQTTNLLGHLIDQVRSCE